MAKKDKIRFEQSNSNRRNTKKGTKPSKNESRLVCIKDRNGKYARISFYKAKLMVEFEYAQFVSKSEFKEHIK